MSHTFDKQQSPIPDSPAVTELTQVTKRSPIPLDSPAVSEVKELSQVWVDLSPEAGTAVTELIDVSHTSVEISPKAGVQSPSISQTVESAERTEETANEKDKSAYDFNRDSSVRNIYENSSCSNNIVRKLFPYEWAVNMKDCIDFCIPNTVRSADQITDILVFLNFQSSPHLLVKMLSIMLFVLAWICSGIRWFVSLREVDIKASKGRPLQRTFLRIYIVPFLGIPMHFLYDIYTSSIKPLFRPRFLQTMRNPGKELAELEFNAFLEFFTESAVSSIIGIILFAHETTNEDENRSSEEQFQDTLLLAVSVSISIYNVIKSAIIVRKQSEKHGYDMLEYVYIRIQFAELKMTQFLPFLGKLESGEAQDVNIAATELVDSDIAVLEECIAPTSGQVLAKGLERFQLSVFSLGRLSRNAAYRFGSMFCRDKEQKIQIFVAKVATMDDVHSLYDDNKSKYESSEMSIYKHDFVDHIILQTTGCVGNAVLRCEETLPYVSKDWGDDKNNLKVRFDLFLRGLFGFDESSELDSEKNLANAFETRNWRAIEFLIGRNEKQDPNSEFARRSESPLREAVAKGDTEMVRFLHSLGADMKKEDCRIQSNALGSLLHIAAENGEEKMIELLKKNYKLDINQLDSLKRTPLFLCRTLDVYDLMLTLGADEDVVDQTQDSLPHDNLIPSTVDEMDEIAEIFARILVSLRTGPKHHIIMTISSYCVPVIANNPDQASDFNLTFFRRCRSWIPYEFQSKVELKNAVDLWCENEKKACDEYGHISNWITSAVKNMSNLFSGKKNFNDDISQWDVSSVTTMRYMFNKAASFNGDLSQWDVSSVTTMCYMFNKAASFNGDLSQWDVSSVTIMRSMFEEASSFNGDLTQWDVSSVTHMSQMFQGASSFNEDLTQWDVSSVTTMRSMFQEASSFNGDLTQWDVSSVIDMSSMFCKASSFNGDLTQWDVSSVIDMHYMFHKAASFNGDLTQWDVSAVIDQSQMFSGASSFEAKHSPWSKRSAVKKKKKKKNKKRLRTLGDVSSMFPVENPQN